MVSFHPQSPISMATVQGSLEEGRVVRTQKEKREPKDMLFFDLIYHFHWSKEGKKTKSNLNKDQNYIL